MNANPPFVAPFVPQIRLYTQWLEKRHGLRFEDYQALWRWSVTELDAFWASMWEYLDLQSPTPHTAVLARKDRKSTRLNSSHIPLSRMPSSA